MGRIAVIGTGVVGACIGYCLAREGSDVLLVDAGTPGGLTTSASFAWVNASSKVTHPAYFELNFAGLREYERLANAFPGATWWNQTGHVRWDYRDERELASSVEELTSRGYPAEVWDAGRARILLGPHAARIPPSSHVAMFPLEGWVDGPNMVKALVDSAVKNGATTAFGSAVCRILVTDRSLTSIELANGDKYAVEAAVNAAGPAAHTVAAMVGRVLPMRRDPGLTVRVETGKELVGRVMHAPEIAIRPDGAGRVFLLAHGVERERREVGHAPAQLAEKVKRLAARVLPELASASVVDVRVGHRPIPADGFPAIGRATNIRGYFEAVMHSGITLGPIVARALTAELVHGREDPLVSSFRASRL
jgi:glycine/D-amino acid oxidase-like deaminating enzyme